MAAKQRKGPLARFTVLDLTRARSGPTAVRQLADWGANVIKIEEPGEKEGAMDDRRHGPDFHADAIGQPGALLRDGDGSVEHIHLKQEVTANGFLRFSERSIRHDTVLAYDLALRFEWIASDSGAFRLEAIKPRHPVVSDLLHLFRRKTFVPVRAAEDQHVSVV